MICMKPECCLNCEKYKECTINCKHDDLEFQKKKGITSIEEFENIYCKVCSFINQKKKG